MSSILRLLFLIVALAATVVSTGAQFAPADSMPQSASTMAEGSGEADDAPDQEFTSEEIAAIADESPELRTLFSESRPIQHLAEQVSPPPERA